MKVARFIRQDKRIFVVHINDLFWSHRFPEWMQLSNREQHEMQKNIYSDISNHLNSNQQTITIFCPFAGNIPLIGIQQICGKKRSRIVFKILPNHQII